LAEPAIDAGMSDEVPTERRRHRQDHRVTDFSIDDPMLALIARFAACCTDHRMSEETFLRHQYDQIRNFVGDAPEDQRQERALEWIVHNAEEYRRKWHRKVAAEAAPDSRCPDCPLEGQDDAKTCEIHERWLGLLNEYLAGAISSRAYVVDTLNLLRDHKAQLKSRAVQLATS
jgi:hypothetical protein